MDYEYSNTAKNGTINNGKEIQQKAAAQNSSNSKNDEDLEHLATADTNSTRRGEHVPESAEATDKASVSD